MIDHHSQWDGTTPYIIAINDPQTRAKVAAELGAPGLTWIHPTAHLGVDTEIGMDTHINYGVTMTRTRVGTCTTIAPGVIIGGDVTIGDRVFIGMGACIGVRHPGEHVSIGDDAIIGAGSVILRDVPAGAKVLGPWT